MYALLIAQNTDERAVLSLVLQRAGVAVTTGNELERAMRSWLERPADLILLALGGSLTDGPTGEPADNPVANVGRIRAETEVPVVVVVDETREELHYDLLQSGADLVISRPFSARLLIAQVRALLRRAGNVPLSSLPTLSLAGLTLDPAARTVQVSSQAPRRLTHLEFRLLYTLMTHHGQTLSPELIVERVWGYTGQGDKELVRGLVSRLRAKVEPEPRTPHYIITAPGIGYAFDPDEA
jgi:DNA-binding response OmpR family regulator